jgi:hypothetical protein
MLVVETIGRIRRELFVHGKSIKAIARDLRLSRNTVRNVLRSEQMSFSYEREVRAIGFGGSPSRIRHRRVVGKEASIATLRAMPVKGRPSRLRLRTAHVR